MNVTVVYGSLIALGIFVVCWFVLVAPSQRRYHERKLAIVQKQLAEREARRIEGGDRATKPVLETKRLRLRKMTVGDSAFMLALLNDADFVKYIGDRGIRSEAEARDYLLNGAIDSYHRHGYGMYLAEQKRDGAAVGICGLVRRDGLDAPDIGFAVLPAFRSLGYATEAISAVLDHAQQDLGLDRVLAIATPDNVASNRILARAGMRLEGSVTLPGDDATLNLYEYEARG